MKILYYSAHPNLNLASPSGYGTHMREMIKAFEEHGHEVKVFIAGGTELNENELDIKFNESLNRRIMKKIIPSILWEGIKDLKWLIIDKKLKRKLRGIVDDWKPDLIYERGIYLMKSGVDVAGETKTRHILEINAPYVLEKKEFNGNSFLNFLAPKIEKFQLENTNLTIVVSSPLKSYFQKLYDDFNPKIEVIPNAINLNYLEFKAKVSMPEFIKKGDLILGFVGSILPYHGIERLVRVFANVSKDFCNLKLLIVGDGETLPQLKEEAKKMKVYNKIIFTGNVGYDEVFGYLEKMDIAVLPHTNWYCSPIKLFEYGALGKAIIAPNLDPVKDVMKDKEDVLLVNDSDFDLEAKVRELILDKNLRKGIGTSFRRKVINEYTWFKASSKILDIDKEIVNQL